MKTSLSPWIFIALFILWLFFVVGSFFVVQKPFEVANVVAIGNIFLNLLIASWLGLVGFASGAWILQRVIKLKLSLAETTILGTGLGLGALGLLSFGCGLIGLFHPLVAYGITILLSLVCFPQIKNLLKRWVQWRSTHRPGRLITIYLIFILFITLVMALLPPTDFDGLFYHLTSADIYVRAGGLVQGYDVPHFSFPALMEMLFAWAMLLRGDIAAKLLHTIFGLLLTGLVYLTARNFFEKRASWLAVLIFLSMPMISTLASWAYNDLALAFYQFAALYAFLRWRLQLEESAESFESSRWLVFSGLLTGLSMGMKYTSFVTPVTISLLIIWTYRRSLGQALTKFILFSAVTVIVGFPWYAKNWAFTGNPVYPFLSSLFGGQYWDEFRAAWYAAAGSGVGFEPKTWLALPWLLTLGVRDANYWDGRTGPLLLLFLPLVILMAFWGHRLRLPWRSSSPKAVPQPLALNPILIYVLAHFAFWSLGVVWSRALWQSRLLLPGLVGLAPVIGWIWFLLPGLDWPQFSLSRFVNITIVLTLFLTMVDIGLLTLKSDPLPYLVGLESREAYLTRHLGAYYATMQQLNEELPPEANILFIGEPRSYFCERKCQPDSILDTFPHLVDRYGSAEEIANAWHETGITHVLLRRGGITILRNDPGKAHFYEPLMEQLSILEARHLEELFDVAEAYQLYRVK